MTGSYRFKRIGICGLSCRLCPAIDRGRLDHGVGYALRHGPTRILKQRRLSGVTQNPRLRPHEKTEVHVAIHLIVAWLQVGFHFR